LSTVDERARIGLEHHEGAVRGFLLGAEFALCSWGKLVPFIAILTVVKVGARAVLLGIPELSAGKQFLVLAAAFLAEVWFFVAVSMLSIEALRGGAGQGGVIIRRAFQLMPKCVLSTVAVLFILLAGLLMPIALPLAVLVLWAPYFVVGEAYSKAVVLDDDDLLSEDEEDPALFTGQGVFDLGIIRGFQFGIRHFQFTVQSVVLIWAAEFVSQAVAIALLTADALGVAATLVSGALRAFLSIAFLHAFFREIPKEGLEELAIRPAAQPPLIPRRWLLWTGSWFRGWLPTVILALGCLIATVLLVNQFKAQLSEGLGGELGSELNRRIEVDPSL
jgi:hypothetical protein